MPNYADNSHKGRERQNPLAPGAVPEEKEKVEPVVTGTVVVKKPGIGSKFKSVFFGGDSKSALRYIAADVVLPAFRDLLVNAATQGVERFVYGESRARPRRPSSTFNYGSRVSYNSPVQRTGHLPDQPPYSPVRPVTARESDSFVVSSREEADLVVERLGDILDKYNAASLGDLLDLLAQPSSHVDQKWGWTNLNGTEIRQIREGFLIELPKIEEI